MSVKTALDSGAMPPSVLFVSKPVDPPINDGSKHVVVTLARHLTRYTPHVMTTRHTPELGGGVVTEPIYEPASSYAPSLLNNLRAARHLGLGRKTDLWHFVFAPNLRSSQMGRWLKKLRGVPCIQTIASRPRQFGDATALLFGDVVVAQSRDTRERFREAWVKGTVATSKCPRIEVIPPALGQVRVPSLDETMAVRQSLDIGPDVPILLYPGDLEVSHGARIAKAAAVVIAERHPTAVVVFAYRDKTPVAQGVAGDLLRGLNPKRVRVVREAPDILSLIRTSAAVMFPVDDLYGKVDLPIVLLEAMALGTPIVTYNQGPLADLDGVEVVSVGDPLALADAAVSLIDDHGRRGRCIEAQRLGVERRHDVTRIVAAYESLYDELLGSRRPGPPPT
jgi:phosphatidylinositol alpha-1,6-mannosyltransferase